MAQKTINISVAGGGILTKYQATGYDNSGRKVAYAYGDNRDQAVGRCADKIRRMYGSTVRILYP